MLTTMKTGLAIACVAAIPGILAHSHHDSQDPLVAEHADAWSESFPYLAPLANQSPPARLTSTVQPASLTL